MTRRDELLRAAVGYLRDMRDPLEHTFLVEHRVTLNECGDLADDLATGALLLLNIHREAGAGGMAGQVAAHRLVEALVSEATGNPQ